MANPNDHPPSNFWFGFSLGIIAAGAIGFLLGTKKGRETLKKLLELSENLEENLFLLGEELGDELRESGNNVKTVEEAVKKNHSTLQNILDKMKGYKKIT